jgi:hypothetical protein
VFTTACSSTAQAVKYTLFENSHHPETIVELWGAIELEWVASFSPPATYPPAAHKLPRRARWHSLFRGQL